MASRGPLVFGRGTTARFGWRVMLAQFLADALLIGVDLAPNCYKTVEQLIRAYDDAAGVTAAFNKNILARLNRELGANFNLDAFRHRAYWNPQDSRIEMHLVSTVAQTVTIGGDRFTFTPGESIHTENSYKFTERGVIEPVGQETIAAMLSRC